jgi:hypothetical protein
MAVLWDVDFSLLPNNILGESTACSFINPENTTVSSYVLLHRYKFTRLRTVSAMRTLKLTQVN